MEEDSDPGVLDKPPLIIKILIFLWPIAWGVMGIFAYPQCEAWVRNEHNYAICCLVVFLMPIVLLFIFSTWCRRRSLIVLALIVLPIFFFSQCTCGFLGWFYYRIYQEAVEPSKVDRTYHWPRHYP
jgi:hypothetical protein